MQLLPKTTSTLVLLLSIPVYVYGVEQQSELIKNYHLLIDNPGFILIDSRGGKHRINSVSGKLQPDPLMFNSIIRKQDLTFIELFDGTKLVFYGSYLVEHTDTRGYTELLSYKSGETLNELHCDNPEPTPDSHCAPRKQFLFSSPLVASNTTQIDIRPPNCKSYFDDYLHTRRGLHIESALASHFRLNGYTPTPQTFPIIDFINGNTAHIIKSRDLSKENLQSKSALYDQLKQDIQEIDKMFEQNTELSANFQNQSMTIRQNQIQRSVLDIVIQNGLATESQKQQILKVINELQHRPNISLNIIEIP